MSWNLPRETAVSVTKACLHHWAPLPFFYLNIRVRRYISCQAGSRTHCPYHVALSLSGSTCHLRIKRPGVYLATSKPVWILQVGGLRFAASIHCVQFKMGWCSHVHLFNLARASSIRMSWTFPPLKLLRQLLLTEPFFPSRQCCL